MPHAKTDWENLPSTNTPINAENLNKIEDNAYSGAEFAESATQIGKDIVSPTNGSSIVAKIGAAPLNHTHAVASTTANGHMSYNDKIKLDSIVSATSSVQGLVKLGSDNTITSTANPTTDITGRTYYVQKLSNGQMAVNVPWVATNYELPVATTEVRGGFYQAVGVEDSDAEELIDLRNSFNELLANLRTAGIMY